MDTSGPKLAAWVFAGRLKPSLDYLDQIDINYLVTTLIASRAENAPTHRARSASAPGSPRCRRDSRGRDARPRVVSAGQMTDL